MADVGNCSCHIPLLSYCRTWIKRPHIWAHFLDWDFITFNQIMYNQLTLRLHRQVHFPRWVFWDGIFTAISQTNTLQLMVKQILCTGTNVQKYYNKNTSEGGALLPPSRNLTIEHLADKNLLQIALNCPVRPPLVVGGPEWLRDLDTDLWLVLSDHETWTQASDWSRVGIY